MAENAQSSEVEYPGFPGVDGLDQLDYDVILKQCEHQGATSLKEVEGFIVAYATAKDFASRPDRLGSLTPEGLLNLVSDLSTMTEPSNTKGYRGMNVTFANGTMAEAPDRIPQALIGWSEAFVDERFESAAESFWRFEKVHPFIDGNGRVGHLLWAIDTVRRGGEWPQELPPDVFGKDAGLVQKEYKSAFGDLEPEA